MFRTLAALCAAVPLSLLAVAPAQATTFNDPFGPPARQRVFLDTVISDLDAMPARSAVTISMYSLSDPAVTDALVRAHRRKVKVRYMTWDQSFANPQLDRLRTELGTDTSAASWLKVCRGSCARSGDVGAQHSKIVAFSTTGKRKRVVLVSSGNLTTGSTSSQWNEFQTVDDDRVYATARDYVFSLTGDRDRFDFPSVTSSDGRFQLSFFPRKRQAGDPVLDTLKATSCKGGGRVWVAMFLWSGKRIATARRLVELKRQGCSVRVLMDSAETAGSVESTLRKGKVPLYDSHVADVYVHAKTTIISAPVRGKRSNIVFAGSPNFSWTARYLNAEALVRMDSKAEADQHFAWFDRVLEATNSKRV